jgi:DNA-binding CsgD family transcriptional regulator
VSFPDSRPDPFAGSRRPDGLLKDLTPRQRDVAEFAATGAGTTEIAQALDISYDAAKMHINAIADQLHNPRLLTPLRLVRQWAIATDYLRRRPLTEETPASSTSP